MFHKKRMRIFQDTLPHLKITGQQALKRQLNNDP